MRRHKKQPVLKVVIPIICGAGEEIKFTFALLCCLGCNFCVYNV